MEIMKKQGVRVVIAVVVLLSVVLAFYFHFQYKKSQKYLKDPSLAGKEQTAKVVAEVARVMELPKNEEPTLGSVADITKLKTQPFFAKAKNGDKILIYTQKKEIILYRESTNKIINVAPISINAPTTAQQEVPPAAKATSVPPSPTPTIVFRLPSPTTVPTP